MIFSFKGEIRKIFIFEPSEDKPYERIKGAVSLNIFPIAGEKAEIFEGLKKYKKKYDEWLIHRFHKDNFNINIIRFLDPGLAEGQEGDPVMMPSFCKEVARINKELKEYPLRFVYKNPTFAISDWYFANPNPYL